MKNVLYVKGNKWVLKRKIFNNRKQNMAEITLKKWAGEENVTKLFMLLSENDKSVYGLILNKYSGGIVSSYAVIDKENIV